MRTLICALTLALGLSVTGTAAAEERLRCGVLQLVGGVETKPCVEVMFALDATASMSDLIDGAKDTIWTIARAIADAETVVDVRMGLVGYRDRGEDFVTRMRDLSSDLDAFFVDLTGYQAEGGGDTPESVNQALHEAVTKPSWTPGPQVARIVILVGDAPPHMDYPDDIPYPATMERARAMEVVVNAIQVGSIGGTADIWREIAALGGGGYVALLQDGGFIDIDTPYDEAIINANRAINATTLPYGDAPAKAEYADKIAARDAAPAEAVSSMFGFTRAKSLPESVVTGAEGELIGDIAQGRVTLEEVEETALPAALATLSPEDRKAKVASLTQERQEISAELAELTRKRDAYVEEWRAERAENGEQSFDAEVIRLVRAQASEKAAVVYREDAPDPARE